MTKESLQIVKDEAIKRFNNAKPDSKLRILKEYYESCTSMCDWHNDDIRRLFPELVSFHEFMKLTV